MQLAIHSRVIFIPGSLQFHVYYKKLSSSRFGYEVKVLIIYIIHVARTVTCLVEGHVA